MNFNPGPAALPLPVLERARDELIDFAGTGMSIMEHSHRGATYEGVHNEAIALLRELMGISDDYEVLFLQGGASQQFAQVPLNFLSPGGSADYVLTGHWGERALAEAQPAAALVGATVRVALSTAEGEGKSATFTRAPRPDEVRASSGAAYLHLTSNETIHGVQVTDFPDTGAVPLVCDMSSDVLSRRVDVSRFAMLYAGAQKNIGPSGVVVVVARKDFVEAGRKDIPAIFQYRTYAANNSLYNTPPTFAIYLVRGVLQWVRESGGLEQVEAWNREKAELLYGAIDRHAGLYRCPVQGDSRSWMNVVFRLPSADLEGQFLTEAEHQGMIGLKGHRSVGGIRVSLYNAVPVEWARALATFMDDFAARAG
jgi:phosphoserine aminotransferase